MNIKNEYYIDGYNYVISRNTTDRDDALFVFKGRVTHVSVDESYNLFFEVDGYHNLYGECSSGGLTSSDIFYDKKEATKKLKEMQKEELKNKTTKEILK